MGARPQASSAHRRPPGAHVPIVALTAHAMEGDAEGILAAGIDRYMTKPLRRAAILDVLGAYHPKGTHPIEAPAEQAPTEAALTGT